jgi:hypothetical protein
MPTPRGTAGAQTGQELHTTYLGPTGTVAAGKDAQAVIIDDVTSGDIAPVTENLNDLANAVAGSQAPRAVFGNSTTGPTSGSNTVVKAQVQTGPATFGSGQPSGAQYQGSGSGGGMSSNAQNSNLYAAGVIGSPVCPQHAVRFSSPA